MQGNSVSLIRRHVITTKKTIYAAAILQAKIEAKAIAAKTAGFKMGPGHLLFFYKSSNFDTFYSIEG